MSHSFVIVNVLQSRRDIVANKSGREYSNFISFFQEFCFSDLDSRKIFFPIGLNTSSSRVSDGDGVLDSKLDGIKNVAQFHFVNWCKNRDRKSTRLNSSHVKSS